MNTDFVALSGKLHFSCTLEGKSPRLKLLQATPAMQPMCTWVYKEYGHAVPPGLTPSSACEMPAEENHRGMCEWTLAATVLLLFHSGSFCLRAQGGVCVSKSQLAGEGKSSPALRFKSFLGAPSKMARLASNFGLQNTKRHLIPGKWRSSPRSRC